MQVEVYPTTAEANERAATLMAQQLREALAERGRGSVALSGGRTPEVMLHTLAAIDLRWADVHLFQVDERIVGDHDPRRNLTSIGSAFAHSPLPTDNIHGMPVNSTPLEAGVAQYYRDLVAVAGLPPRLDVVHLGLGEDGHTASLIPNDHTLDADGDVAISGLYQGTRRVTLTLHAINRARCRLWLVTGPSKREVVRRFVERDAALVASRVSTDAAIVVLDQDAAGE